MMNPPCWRTEVLPPGKPDFSGVARREQLHVALRGSREGFLGGEESRRLNGDLSVGPGRRDFVRFGNRENNLEHTTFCLGAWVIPAAQPEPLVLKQPLFYSPPGNQSPREGGREDFISLYEYAF